MNENAKINLVAPRDLLERALSSPKGIRVWFASQADAVSMRNRMATVKTQDRKHSCKLYDISSPLYNKSPFDELAIVLKSGIYSINEELQKVLSLEPGEIWSGTWMYILPAGTSDAGFVVEEL